MMMRGSLMKAGALTAAVAVVALLLAGPASAGGVSPPTSYGFLELTYSNCKPAEAARTYSSYAGVGPWYAGQYNLSVNSAANSHSSGDAGGTLWAQAQANGFLVGPTASISARMRPRRAAAARRSRSGATSCTASRMRP